MNDQIYPHSSSILQLGKLDHYTMIVENAKKASDFHCDILGFKFKEIKPINTGTVPNDEHDMLNYILILPSDANVLCVITEGLNDDTVFSQYLKKYGEGIHHMAYQTNNLKSNWQLCKENSIETTSSKIIVDPVSGLEQIFISKRYTGYFIELIERKEVVEKVNFTSDNMKKLSDTMKEYV